MLRTRLTMGFFGTKGQVTPKSIVRSGRNSSEILCLSRLSATVILIRLLLKGYVPCKAKYVFRHSRASHSDVKSMLWPKFELVWDFMAVLVWCSCYLQVWRRSDQKWSRYPPDNVFPIISLWALSVAVETRVLIKSAPKRYAHFPHLNDATDVHVWKSGWRRTDHWYTISSTCESSVQVSQTSCSNGQWSLTWDQTCLQSKAGNSKVNTSPLMNILYLSYLPASLILDKNYTGYTSDKVEYGFFHSRASNSKVNSLILPEFKPVWDFMPVQVTCKFHKDPIKTKQAMLLTRWNTGFFGTKGQVTPKSIVQSGQNSNSSVLSASFIKIPLKLKRLCSRKGQIQCFSSLKG